MNFIFTVFKIHSLRRSATIRENADQWMRMVQWPATAILTMQTP